MGARVSGPGEQHPWAKAWGDAVTPEQRQELWALVRSKRAEGDLRRLAEDREVKAKVETRRCERCKAPLASLRRTVCPPCTHLGNASRGVRGGA